MDSQEKRTFYESLGLKIKKKVPPPIKLIRKGETWDFKRTSVEMKKPTTEERKKMIRGKRGKKSKKRQRQTKKKIKKINKHVQETRKFKRHYGSSETIVASLE